MTSKYAARGLVLLSSLVLLAEFWTPSVRGDDALAVKPYLGDTTFLVVKIDPTRVDPPELDKVLGKQFDSLPEGARESTTQISAAAALLVKRFRDLTDDQTVYAVAGIPIAETKVPLFAFRKQTTAENVAKIKEVMKFNPELRVSSRDGNVVISPVGMEPGDGKVPAATHENIAAAFASVVDYPVQVLVVPPEYVWRTIRELSPELPSQVGGGPSDVLTEGLVWMAIGVDPTALKAEVIIQSASNDAAKKFAARLPALLQAGYDNVEQLHAQVSPELVKLLIGWRNHTHLG